MVYIRNVLYQTKYAESILR